MDPLIKHALHHTLSDIPSSYYPKMIYQSNLFSSPDPYDLTTHISFTKTTRPDDYNVTTYGVFFITAHNIKYIAETYFEFLIYSSVDYTYNIWLANSFEDVSLMSYYTSFVTEKCVGLNFFIGDHQPSKYLYIELQSGKLKMLTPISLPNILNLNEV